MRRVHLRIFFLVSLILHLLMWTSSMVLPQNPSPKPQVIEFSLEETPPPTPKNQMEIKRQIVDQDEVQLNDEVDPDAKYLSRHNQKVLKQTVAQNRGEFKNRKQSQNNPRQLTLAELTPKMDFKKIMDERQLKEKEFEASAPATQKRDLALSQPTPKGDTAGQNRPVAEASQTLDYIKELDPGLETMLSTREFLYYSFYSRVREQLNQHWSTKVRESLTKVYKQGRNIASNDDKITKVLVTLDRQGKLVKVQIIGNSGIRELDEAAADSFKSAAPFLNPPEGIVEPDGTIRLRWDFILEA